MTHVVLDDHLLRDFLADGMGIALTKLIEAHEVATTNLYYVRLTKSAVSARGGRLTGAWSAQRREALARTLVDLPAAVTVVPMRSIAYRMGLLARDHPISTLGAEAVAAAEYLVSPLCVWDGDDGPGIRACAAVSDVPYRVVRR